MLHQHPQPSLHPSVVWVRRIRKGRPGGTVVDTDLCPGGGSVMGDTDYLQGVPPPSWGTQPCPRGGCQSGRRGAAPPWACLVSGEPRPQPGALIPCSLQHCLLGWDIIPPKSEKSSAPKTLDLWSSVSSEAHHQKLSATGSPHLVRPGCPGRGRHLGAAWGLQSLWGRSAEPGSLSLWAPISLALTPSLCLPCPRRCDKPRR